MITSRKPCRLSPVGPLLLTLITLGAVGDTKAQFLPANAIRIVVPAIAGTPPDVSCRIIANELADSEGWRIVVENKSGSGGVIAATSVFQQPADGTTILMATQPESASPSLINNVPLALDTDFAPVIKTSVSYNVLVVHPSIPSRSVSELVALLKSQPDKFNFSSGGFGTPAHLIGEMFKLQVGVRATHVPYQGQQRMTDLLNGTTHFSFLSIAQAVDLIAAGRLRALAVTAPRRIAVLKDVPTIVEQGYPQLVVEGWDGFAVKSGTSNDIITRLNGAVNKVLTRPKVREALANVGAGPAGGTPAEFGDLIKSQMVHWARVVKESGIKIAP
jgi:tripartite-type tricarboxylate transporter receptor subunit TctC